MGRVAAGWTLLVTGAVLILLPGPGIPLVVGGLVLLAREHAWAKRLEKPLRHRWERAWQRRGAPGARQRT